MLIYWSACCETDSVAPKGLFTQSPQQSLAHALTHPPIFCAQIVYVGLFLTLESRQLLLQHLPSLVHPNFDATHVTLAYMLASRGPSSAGSMVPICARLPTLGTRCRLKVRALVLVRVDCFQAICACLVQVLWEASDDKTQAVAVQVAVTHILPPRFPLEMHC